MNKKEAALAIHETAAYIGRNGGRLSAIQYSSPAYEIETDYGPAQVTLILSAARGGMPWLALRYRDMDQVRVALANGKLPAGEIGWHAGKFNCHAADASAGELAAHFKQHLTRAGFRETQPAESEPNGGHAYDGIWDGDC